MRHVLLTAALLIAFAAQGVAVDAPSDKDRRKAELEAAIATAGDQATAANLVELGRLVWGSDPARALELAQRALSRTGADRPAELADAHELIGRSLLRLERYEEALEHLVPAQKLYQEVGDTTRVARCDGYEAMARSHIGQLWPAIEAGTRALELFREIGDERGVAASANNLGIYYERAGEYEKALELNLESLERERALHHDLGVANSLNSVGNIYARLEERQKARESYLQALEIFERLGERYGTSQVLNNLGNTYEEVNEDETALGYFQRALAAGEADGAATAQTPPLTGLGAVYTKQKHFEEALASYRRAADLERGIGDRGGLAVSLQHIGEVLLLMGRLDEAQAELGRSRDLSLEIGSKAGLDETYLKLAELAARRGDYRRAYENLQRHGEVRDALLDADKSRAIAELEARYEAGKRREQIELLTKDNELLRKDGEIRRLQLGHTRLTAVLLSVAVLVLVGGGLLVARRYRSLLAFWRRRSFVGPYRLADRIAEGGMGIVYRAVNVTEPSRTVALKVIREELAGDEAQRRRFLNEGRLVDGLDHPNIVKVFERGEHNQQLYIAMELLEGRTLADLIAESARQRRVIPEPSCLAIMRQLADAVRMIHAHGILHRDIKPTNVVLVPTAGADTLVKLLDFGLARSDTMTTLTEAGEIVGTMSYLAPERLQHRPLEPSSDVFSLGAVFFELLTLEPPFFAEDAMGLLRCILECDPLPVLSLRPDLDPELAGLVESMLHKAPERRPDDEEIGHRLARLGVSLAAS